MSNTEQQIEQEIQDKGLNAPRLTPEHIDSKIKAIRYITGDEFDLAYCADDYKDCGSPQLTICILSLENGFTVTGESACASPENFDRIIGQKIAYQNAREKIWQIEGYLLKEQLYKQSKQAEPQEAIDKLLETRIPILDQIHELCLVIEECGASPKLTEAVTKAGALRDPISELVKQAVSLGIGHGIVSVSHSNDVQLSTADSFEPTIQPKSIDGSLNPLNPTNFTQYVGTKELLAMPMTRGDWCKYNGWQLPPNENGNDDGYMVQYLDGGKPNHPNHPFYISWSPKDVFERTYHAVDGELPVPTAVNCGESSGSVGEAKSCSGNVSYGNHRAIELLLEILRGTNVGSDVSDKARTKLSELVDTI